MKEQLQEISQKSQAETIDLWPEIYAELKETKTVKTPIQMNFLPRLIAVLSLFFVGALVAYAISQIYVDTGLEGERAERLVTPMDISITKGHTTIHLDWAYADISRISLGYTMYDEDGRVVVPDSPARYQANLYLREVGSEGHGLSITGFENGWREYRLDYDQQVFSESFDLMDLPEELTEAMEVDFQLYWEGQLYRFVFPLTVYPAQFEVHDLTMIPDSSPITSIVKEFSITPTMTILNICVEVPQEYQRHSPRGWNSIWGASEIRIYFDGQDIAERFPNVTGYFAPYGSAFGLGCTLFKLEIPADVLPQTVRITFQDWREDRSWSFPTMEEAEALASVYQAHGINATAADDDYSNDFIVVWPEEFWNLPVFEKQRVYDDVMDDYFATNPIEYSIPGFWEIEFQVSEPIN